MSTTFGPPPGFTYQPVTTQVPHCGCHTCCCGGWAKHHVCCSPPERADFSRCNCPDYWGGINPGPPCPVHGLPLPAQVRC